MMTSPSRSSAESCPFATSSEPTSKRVGSFVPSAIDRETVVSALGALVSQPNYPCIAALKSIYKKDFQIGIYGEFGSGQSWSALRQDLLRFVELQKQSKSIYLTYFAVFQPQTFSEESFETALWNELSNLTSTEEMLEDWADPSHADPSDKNFRFSLGGTEFFVVGLHTNSSRLARKFPYPMMIFNVFAQFEALEKLGQYESMIQTNRSRDIKFQGQVNPMVEQHGDNWEPIQFSGKSNSKEWKCPFHFLLKKDKVKKTGNHSSEMF